MASNRFPAWRVALCIDLVVEEGKPPVATPCYGVERKASPGTAWCHVLHNGNVVRFDSIVEAADACVTLRNASQQGKAPDQDAHLH